MTSHQLMTSLSENDMRDVICVMEQLANIESIHFTRVEFVSEDGAQLVLEAPLGAALKLTEVT